MTYLELEDLCQNREICLFGAGGFGKTKGYACLKCFGIKVDFYCDNHVPTGTVIRDGIKVRDISYLYENKDKIQVFLTVGANYQQEITTQLQEHGIENIIIVDWLLISQVLDSIDASDDEVARQRYHAIYNDEEYLPAFYEFITGEKLDLHHPRTFNEKLQWLKVYNRRPEYTRMVDKYEAKHFIDERIGSGYTIPTIGVWDSFDEIDFDMLPEQFVLKCTHDSNSIVIVEDKENLDKEKAKRTLDRALKKNYFWYGREWSYKNVKPRIIAEAMLPERNLNDYKFFCFDGTVKMIQVDLDRFINHKRNFYNREWKYESFMQGYPTAPEITVEKPKCLEEMIEIAEKLSVSIPHIRVDFYIIDDRPVVGELTFFHECGIKKFTPIEWDLTFGEWITLPKKTENNTNKGE